MRGHVLVARKCRPPAPRKAILLPVTRRKEEGLDRENRERAVRLLEEKRGGGKATYSDIALETGYSIR